LHPEADRAGVIFCTIPIRDWDPGSDPTDLGMAGRSPDSTALDDPPEPNNGPAPTEPGGPPATLEGEDDGRTSPPDPTLDTDPAPPLPGPYQGPGREAVADDTHETFRPTALLSMLGLTYGSSAAPDSSAGPQSTTPAAVPALPFRESSVTTDSESITGHKRPSLRRMRRHPRDDSPDSPPPFPPAQGAATPCPVAPVCGLPAAAEDGERTLPAGPSHPAPPPQPTTPAQPMPPVVWWDEKRLVAGGHPTGPTHATPTRWPKDQRSFQGYPDQAYSPTSHPSTPPGGDGVLATAAPADPADAPPGNTCHQRGLTPARR